MIILISAAAAVLGSCVESGGDPAENSRILIKLAAPQNAYIENFDSNIYKLWLEEQTGLKIEMNWLPEADAERIAQIALASGDGLPDAYIGFGSDSHNIFSNLNLQKYGESGSIIPLNDLIEQHGVNLKSVWNELAEHNIKQFMTLPDGNIYYMPGFSSSPITRYRQIMWVNKGWLDNLGLAVPETTEEFRGMLMAFRDGDPNGNGLRDEIPMAGTEEFYSKQPGDFLFNAFVYNDVRNSRLILENGLVKFAPVTDEWREALRYMRGLYDERLYSPLSFTQSDQQQKQMANDPRDILGAFASPGITFTALQNSPEIMERYIGIGPLAGPNGVRLSTVFAPLPKPNGVITSACENPEEVFKLFDLMLSEEACLMGRYGEYGIDWETAGAKNISIFGTPATINIINQIWNIPQNKHLCQIVPYISRPKFSGGVTWDGTKTDGEYINAQAAVLYQEYEPDEFIGELSFTAEEEEHIINIRADTEIWVKQSVADFIQGKRDIENDGEWAAYKKEFDVLGLEMLINTAQTAADRINSP
ncbi:MAG: extracellular solute-binding protein [Oscillospiraceae bacterium]|nr:extracellular solute-binding protein [Oscillospiraceae bacterium]